jgi:hypothetical protein
VTPSRLITFAINPALSLLPEKMDSYDARRMLIAIAMQESRIRYRRQIRGPVHSYWQSERFGGMVHGCMSHHATKEHYAELCNALDYSAFDGDQVYIAIEHNDVLAAGLARLLLWTLPQKLPMHVDDGWSQYLEAWRPVKPHPETWGQNWLEAEDALNG